MIICLLNSRKPFPRLLCKALKHCLQLFPNMLDQVVIEVFMSEGANNLNENLLSSELYLYCYSSSESYSLLHPFNLKKDLKRLLY